MATLLGINKCATGKRIAKLMEDKEYTCEAMAFDIGASATTVRDWRQGRTIPTLLSIVKMAQVLECGIDDIVCLGKEA